MSNYRDMINAIKLTKKEEEEIESTVKKLMEDEYDKFTKEEQTILLKQYYAHKNSPLDFGGYLKKLKKRLNFPESRNIFLKAYENILSEREDDIKKGVKSLEDNLDRLDYDILLNVYSILSKAYLSIDDIKNAKLYANLVLEIDPFFPSAREIVRKL